MSWNAALLPLSGLLVNVLAVVALARRGVSLLKSVYGGFILGAVLVLGADFQAGAQGGKFVSDALIFGALGYGFFHFVNMGETARRIRLLLELREGGALTEAELLSRYNADGIVGARMGRLLRNGQVRLVEGRYAPGAPAVLFMERALTAMKRIFLGRPRAENFKI